VQVLLGQRSLLRISEAHKGILGLSFLRKDLYAFNISEFRENFLQLLVGSVSGEVLNIQVASLL